MDGVTSNKARALVSDFNKKRYAQKEFKAISSLPLDRENDIPMLIVRDFSNADDAMKYYDVIAEFQDEFLDDNFEYEVYAMSQRNYRELFKSKKVEEYKTFFEENYLK